MIRCSALQQRPREFGPQCADFTYFDAVETRFAKLQFQVRAFDGNRVKTELPTGFRMLDQPRRLLHPLRRLAVRLAIVHMKTERILDWHPLGGQRLEVFVLEAEHLDNRRPHGRSVAVGKR
jgi:hypothetical protein